MDVDRKSRTAIIWCMYRSSQKLLASLLVLLVGLLPLQGSAASLAAGSNSDHGAMSHHATLHAQDGAAVSYAAQMTHCGDCCVGSHCDRNSACSSVQCGSCSLAMLSLFDLPERTADPVPSEKSQRPARPSLSLPFRPPRV